MTGRTLLITGSNGFVGPHVAATAAGHGLRVWATGREAKPSDRLAPHCDEYFSRDLSKEWRIPAEVDLVVHLAGLAAVGPSFERPQEYISVNSSIMTNMCEALMAANRRPRMVVVSSGSVYAPPRDESTALDESAPVSASSPYAVAKMLVESQAAYYARRGLDTIVARPFNHIGPGQASGFLVPDLAQSLDALPPEQSLEAGNLHAARDFTDVRDVASAYVTLSVAPSHDHDLYNVASGAAHNGFDVLATICDASNRPVPEVRIDPGRLRPSDPMRIVGDARRLTAEFGWKPAIPWTQSIRDYLTDRAGSSASGAKA
ncbi:NAD-dependent epimerase/dehydratase family protein [Microbacterium sp. BDGP8]|uniref:NAD-dependent epimerase/dehydratase family protein n=1 Tax=Microbacterium sp. BDGP8 TaxID=3035531 RepID=UPI00249D94B1|nr:NAD-dependent epimerase/dehydratase family protein [Microbacterium sp. BDGP8]WHE35751.1 GDP-mannose 4,6-dehydratase [Microbacterium sp. BDGP8]